MKSMISCAVTDLDFDSVDVDATDTAEILLKNSGTGDAHIRAITTPSSPFSIVNDGIWVIKPSDSVVVRVAFNPTTEESFADTVAFGFAYIYTEKPIRVRLQGTGIPATSGLTVQAPPFVISPELSPESRANVVFSTTLPEVNVMSMTLRDGTDFFLTPQTMPVKVVPSNPIVVEVTFRPTGPTTFIDTLVVTTDRGTAHVERRGYILTSVAEHTTVCSAYPNPSNRTVSWCGRACAPWQIVNTVGEIVAIVTSDEQGACSWSTSTAGVYMLVSQRGDAAMRVVIQP